MLCDELHVRGAGEHSQFVECETHIVVERSTRLVEVALCKVCFDEGALRALTKRLDRDCTHRRVDGLGEFSESEESATESLECMEQFLAKALTLDEHPVVVPPR